MTELTNEHCLCPKRADHECNNASLCYFFTLVKLLEVGIWLCSVAQPPSHTLVRIYQKIFRDRPRNNFCCICLRSLTEPPGLKPECVMLRTGGAQYSDFMMRARFHVLLKNVQAGRCVMQLNNNNGFLTKLVIIFPQKQFSQVCKPYKKTVSVFP